MDDVAQGRQGGDDLGDVCSTIDVLGAIAVAVDGDEHDGLDLPEAVDDRANPELWGATRPDRPERGGGEQGDERFGNVRGIGDDAIARSDPELAQGGCAPLDTEREVFPRQLDRVARLADGDDGDGVGFDRAGCERMLGVVQRAAGKPAHVWHRVAVADRRRRGRPAQARELCGRLPEVVEVVDRPADQRVEVVEALGSGEAAESGGLPGVVGRRPQHLAAGHLQRPTPPAAATRLGTS